MPTEVKRRDAQARLLAAALYELRILLSGHVGRADGTPEAEAAAIAWALHNEALAMIESGTFDVEAALTRLASVDRRLQTDATKRLLFHLGGTLE